MNANYGMADVLSMFGAECYQQNGLHFMGDDVILPEIINPETLEFLSINKGTLGELVLTNLKKLVARNENITIRVPIIPEFNHTFQEMKEIIDLTSSLKTIREIHFLPFHNLGSAKYEMLGMKYKYNVKQHLDPAEMQEYVAYAESVGLTAKIGG